MDPTRRPDESTSARILVADDDADMRAWLRRALETAGYDVLEAGDGRKAMNLIRRQAVDLVITDLAMPEQEGMETIRLLRHEHPALKIIAISGSFGETFLPVAKRLGAAAALKKPIEIESLLQTVRQLLKEQAAP